MFCIIKIITMCYFPDSQPATSPSLARARTIMQLMAAGLILVALFAILAQQFFFVIYGLFLAYMLYIGWAKFDYIWTLYFFLICCFQAMMCYVWLIGIIQYFTEIRDKDALIILLQVSKMFYFFNAVFFSHYCYKIFKQAASNSRIEGGYELMPVSNPNLNNLASSQTDRSHQIFREGGFRAFQGQGISLG